VAKDKEKDRDWDKELAEVDKLLAKLPLADPYLKGDAAATKRPPGAAVHHGGPGGGGSHGLATDPRAWIGTWARVGLGLLIGIGMTQWPYTHGCGLRLIFYMVGIAAVVVAGVWSGISSWRRRLGLAHVLSLGLIIWGLILTARVILPRAGYAKTAGTWLCPDVPPAP
jgi:hypothetical protein